MNDKSHGPIQVIKTGICVYCGKDYKETQYYRSEGSARLFKESPNVHRKCRLAYFAADLMKGVVENK